jgi:Fur family transcriptional regulator, ferric uptake regulator
MDQEYFVDILKMNSLGITMARIAIIQFFVENDCAFIELNKILKMTPDFINRTTLYRTLMAFCAANLLYKIVDTRNKVFYGIGDKLKIHTRITQLTNKHNYHFQCSTCHKIFCLPLRAPNISLPEGFTKTNTNFLLTGKCNKCTDKV